MKKWYNEEYEFEIEVTGFLRGDHTEHYCRNGEEVGDQFHIVHTGYFLLRIKKIRLLLPDQKSDTLHQRLLPSNPESVVYNYSFSLAFSS